MVCRSSFVVTPITPGRTCLSLVCGGKMLGKHKNCSSVKLSRSCLSERESRSRLVVCSAGAGGGARGHRWGGTAAGRAVIGAPVPCAPLSPAPRGERTVSPAREQLAGALKCTCWRAFFRGGGGKPCGAARARWRGRRRPCCWAGSGRQVHGGPASALTPAPGQGVEVRERGAGRSGGHGGAGRGERRCKLGQGAAGPPPAARRVPRGRTLLCRPPGCGAPG